MSLGIIMKLLAVFIILYKVFYTQSIQWTSEKNFLEGKTSYNIKVTIMSLSHLLTGVHLFVHLTFSLHGDLVLMMP